MKFPIIFLLISFSTLSFAHVSFINHLRPEHGKGDKNYFDYENPSKNWPNKFKTCTGWRQSPIDINLRYLKNAYLPPLEFLGYDNLPVSIKIENNGHSVQLSGEWLEGTVPSVRGGPLNDIYEFSQMHFHWGKNDNTGSEHTVNGRRFPLEMHVVHWNKKYSSAAEAAKYHDGLAVLGYLISLDEYQYQNIGIENIIAGFSRISKPKQETNINPFPLAALELEIMTQGYITYLGSLTTPPCSESVTWLIAGQNLRGISRKEINSFRNLQLNNNDNHNYRPIQPLVFRDVYYVQTLNN